MNTEKTTQTARVVAALKGRWLTYIGMIDAASTPNAHRRALEWLDRQAGWKLDKRQNAAGWTEWRIVRAKA